MEIPIELKNRLLSELNYVIQRITNEENPTRKKYFLSAAHGAFGRTMRFYLDNELLVVHTILNVCFNTLTTRINSIKSGDVAVPLPSDYWGQIVNNLSDLKTLIEENRSTYPALERIMRFTYSITGPGHYTRSYLESMTSDET